MNVLVVGLGSMGKRRARLIQSLGYTVYGQDNAEERRHEAESLGIKTYDTLQNALDCKSLGAVFVCSAPLSHAGIINEALSAGLPVFSELNLVNDGYEQLIKKAKDNKLVLFLSNTMLYRAEINAIKTRVQNAKQTVNYIYHIGQYLPDWHPWENYKNFFVGSARTSAVREILGIELPWLVSCFGSASAVCVQGDKISGLEVEYNDSVFITLRHKSGAKGVLCADVVCPKAVRNLEVFGERLQLFWQGTPDSLYEYDVLSKEKKQINTYANVHQDARYSDNIVENAYLDEVVNFFAVLAGKEKPLWSFDEDTTVIKLMDEIEDMQRGAGQ